MQTQAGKHSFFQRFLVRESQPAWSLATGLFFVLAYALLWIIGQIIISTLSGSTTPTPSGLSFGALLGCLITIVVAVQWARRRFQPDWLNTLHLRAPLKPPLFAVILVGLGLAW